MPAKWGRTSQSHEIYPSFRPDPAINPLKHSFARVQAHIGEPALWADHTGATSSARWVVGNSRCRNATGVRANAMRISWPLMNFPCSKKAGAPADPLVTVLENKPSRNLGATDTAAVPAKKHGVASNVTQLIGESPVTAGASPSPPSCGRHATEPHDGMCPEALAPPALSRRRVPMHTHPHGPLPQATPPWCA